MDVISTPEDAHKRVRVFISILKPCVDSTRERIAIVGSDDAVGNWKVSCAKIAAFVGNNDWLIEIFLKANTKFDFQLLVIRPSSTDVFLDVLPGTKPFVEHRETFGTRRLLVRQTPLKVELEYDKPEATLLELKTEVADGTQRDQAWQRIGVHSPTQSSVLAIEQMRLLDPYQTYFTSISASDYTVVREPLIDLRQSNSVQKMIQMVEDRVGVVETGLRERNTPDIDYVLENPLTAPVCKKIIESMSDELNQRHEKSKKKKELNQQQEKSKTKNDTYMKDCEPVNTNLEYKDVIDDPIKISETVTQKDARDAIDAIDAGHTKVLIREAEERMKLETAISAGVVRVSKATPSVCPNSPGYGTAFATLQRLNICNVVDSHKSPVTLCRVQSRPIQPSKVSFVKSLFSKMSFSRNNDDDTEIGSGDANKRSNAGHSPFYKYGIPIGVGAGLTAFATVAYIKYK